MLQAVVGFYAFALILGFLIFRVPLKLRGRKWHRNLGRPGARGKGLSQEDT